MKWIHYNLTGLGFVMYISPKNKPAYQLKSGSWFNRPCDSGIGLLRDFSRVIGPGRALFDILPVIRDILELVVDVALRLVIEVG